MSDNINNFIEKIELWKKEKKMWYYSVCFLSCIVTFVTVYALILPAITLITNDGNIPITIYSEWDDTQNIITDTSISFRVVKDYSYVVQYSEDGGNNWIDTTLTTGKIADKVAKQGPYTIDSSELINIFSNFDNRYRVLGVKDANNRTVTNSFNLIDVLNCIKPGFESRLNEMHSDDMPTTLSALYDDFDDYYHLPTAEVTLGEAVAPNYTVTATVTTDIDGNYLYLWQYENDGVWTDIGEATDETEILTNDIEELLEGGGYIRCKVLNADDSPNYPVLTISEPVHVNPREELYNHIAADINENLNLDEYPIFVNKAATTANIEIDSDMFNDRFYWGAVARDDKVDFDSPETYKAYLVNTYLTNYNKSITEGLAEEAAEVAAYKAVKEKWDYYLYDLYDPNWQSINNVGNRNTYNFGDNPSFEWPKDSYTSFHTNLSSGVDLLNYGTDAEGVDYSNFVKQVNKKVTADDSGDDNESRSYNVELEANVQAVTAAPIAIIFQIQSSWQMFDMDHASRGEKNGALVEHTSLATLYDIKHAIYEFIKYMHEHHDSNNILLGITEVKHEGSTSMFNQNGVYYTNNYDALLNGITSWDIFGNCEGVHYDTNTLVNALNSLPINLDVWNDIYNSCDESEENDNCVTYNKIQKDVIIIGGATEMGSQNITLPWGTFTQNDINSVYAIRANEGTPTTGSIISWLDSSGNIPNNPVPYHDGVGNTYTREYYSTSKDAILENLIQIAENDMRSKGTDNQKGDKFVEDLVLKDVIENEFQLDEAKPIVATISDENSNLYQTTINLSNNTISFEDVVNNTSVGLAANIITKTLEDNSIKRTITFDTEQEYTTTSIENGQSVTKTFNDSIPQELIINEKIDGTTEISYKFDKVYNTKKLKLEFGIKAKQDFIGGNNVYTNVGAALASYTHYELDENGNYIGTGDTYTTRTTSTPQVNVPVDFSLASGDSKIVYADDESIDLSNLDTSKIINSLQNILEKYDQINGTLTYSWILPNGVVTELGSTEVVNSNLQQNVSLNYTWRLADLGNYTAALNITFTPAAANPYNPNFANETTAYPVTAQTKSGQAELTVVGGEEKTNIIIKKRWLTVPPVGFNSLNTYLYADGNILTDEDDTPIVYALTPDNNWELTVYDLPVYENYHKIVYEVEEEELEGYITDYKEKTIVTDIYSIDPVVSLTPNEDIRAGKSINVHYKINNVDKTFSYTAPSNITKNISYDIHLDPVEIPNPDDYNFSLTSVNVENTTYTMPNFEVTTSNDGVMLNFTFTVTEKVAKNNKIIVTYNCGGTQSSYEWIATQDYNPGTEIVASSELLPSGEYSLVSAGVYDNKNALKKNLANLNYSLNEPHVSGHVNTPMLLIGNSASIKFPDTGSRGYIIYVLTGIIFMIVPLVCGCIWYKKRKNKA